MNLEEINKKYLQLKTDLEKANSDKKALDAKLNDLIDDKDIQRGKLVEAKRNNDDVAKQNAENEIKRIDGEIQKVKEDAQTKLADAIALQAKIDEKIAEIQANPEMKEHLDSVIAKKNMRKVKELENKRDEAKGKKDRITALQTLVTDHPALANNLKGILSAQNEIKKLKAELDNLTKGGAVSYQNAARVTEITTKLIPNAEAKLNTNKTPLMAYITKNNMNIKEEDLDEIVARGAVIDGKGNIDLTTTFNKNIGALNRQIKGYDKSIADYSRTGIGQNVPIGPAPTSPAPTSPAPTTPATSGPKKWLEKAKNLFKSAWNWVKGKDTPQLPPAQNQPSTQSNAFKDSMKYDIVKDVVNQMQEQGLKEAKTERKSTDNER